MWFLFIYKKKILKLRMSIVLYFVDFFAEHKLFLLLFVYLVCIFGFKVIAEVVSVRVWNLFKIYFTRNFEQTISVCVYSGFLTLVSGKLNIKYLYRPLPGKNDCIFYTLLKLSGPIALSEETLGDKLLKIAKLPHKLDRTVLKGWSLW